MRFSWCKNPAAPSEINHKLKDKKGTGFRTGTVANRKGDCPLKRIYRDFTERDLVHGGQGARSSTGFYLAPFLMRSEYRICVAFDRIIVDPKICGGKPTVRGLRITVDFVLKLLGDGYTAEQIVAEYPELEVQDVYQAAKYGAWLASERTTAV